jgi:SPP1 gp7 family putative phage head morphogenesis protein
MKLKAGMTTPPKPGIFAQAQAQAETLIRTAIVAEFNTARLIAFAEEGVQIIEWVSVIDDATTDECLGLNGLRWRLPDDPLDFAAYEPVGHDVPFPGAVAHWNCRSVQVPVDEDGEMLAAGSLLAMDV